jgi:hypothetical protein
MFQHDKRQAQHFRITRLLVIELMNLSLSTCRSTCYPSLPLPLVYRPFSMSLFYSNMWTLSHRCAINCFLVGWFVSCTTRNYDLRLDAAAGRIPSLIGKIVAGWEKDPGSNPDPLTISIDYFSAYNIILSSRKDMSIGIPVFASVWYFQMNVNVTCLTWMVTRLYGGNQILSFNSTAHIA